MRAATFHRPPEGVPTVISTYRDSVVDSGIYNRLGGFDSLVAPLRLAANALLGSRTRALATGLTPNRRRRESEREP
jgi:hypothetical protein